VIGYLQNDGKHVPVGCHVAARELESVHHTCYIGVEWVAAVARKEAILAGVDQPGLGSERHRRIDDDGFATMDWCYVSTLVAADGRRLRAVCERRKPHAKRYVSAIVAVCVDLEFVNRMVREPVTPRRPWRIEAARRMHVHDRDRLIGIIGLAEHVQVANIQPRVTGGKSEVRSREMVRHLVLTSVGKGTVRRPPLTNGI